MRLLWHLVSAVSIVVPGVVNIRLATELAQQEGGEDRKQVGEQKCNGQWMNFEFCAPMNSFGWSQVWHCQENNNLQPRAEQCSHL